MAFKDPAVSTWFGIEFQGQIAGAFRECTGLGSENEVVEEKASGPKGEQIIKKIPGRMKWGDITLKRGKTDSADFWKWIKEVQDGKIDTARRNASVVLYDYERGEKARFNITNAWPSKVSIGSLQAGGSEVVIEECTIVHEGLEVA